MRGQLIVKDLGAKLIKQQKELLDNTCAVAIN